MVYGVCRRLLNHHDAEDAFQAAFMVLARKASSVVPREMVGNWLYGVAHQAALQGRRLAARQGSRERQVAEMPEPAAAEEDLWRDLRPLLDLELSRLPDKYRSVVVLCDLEGRPRKEVARQLGCPEGTLAAWLARGRKQLARRLARHGLAVSAGTLAGALSPKAAADVPVSLTVSTTRAVTQVGAASAPALALTQGVLHAMLLTRFKYAAVVALLVCVLGTGLGAGLLAGPDQQPAAPQREALAGGDSPKTAELQRRLQDLDERVKSLTRELETLRKEMKPAPAEVKVFRLRSLEAAEAAKILDELFNGKGKWERITITAEPATNSVLARGSALDLISIASLLARLDDRDAAARADLDSLQGTWTVVSQKMFGPRPGAVMKQLEWTFQGNHASARWALVKDLSAAAEGSFAEGKLGLTFTTDSAKSPREITFTVVQNGRGKLLGIYRLEGDTLTLATRGWFEEARPTGFTARDAGEAPLVVCVLKRKQPTR